LQPIKPPPEEEEDLEEEVAVVTEEEEVEEVLPADPVKARRRPVDGSPSPNWADS
jgi:hypothetical protein